MNYVSEVGGIFPSLLAAGRIFHQFLLMFRISHKMAGA